MTNPYDAMFFGSMYYCTKQNKYINAHGRLKGLTEQREMTGRQIHHVNLSKEMCPLFCPVPFLFSFSINDGQPPLPLHLKP